MLSGTIVAQVEWERVHRPHSIAWVIALYLLSGGNRRPNPSVRSLLCWCGVISFTPVQNWSVTENAMYDWDIIIFTFITCPPNIFPPIKLNVACGHCPRFSAVSGGLAPASSQTPTWLLTHSVACREKVGRIGKRRLMGWAKDREITYQFPLLAKQTWFGES